MFTEQDSPRVFALPPGVDFTELFLRGFTARSRSLGPLDVARTVIYVNTRRAQRGLEAGLVKGHMLSGPLPRIRVLGDIGADGADLLPAIPPLKRQLTLATLVRRLLEESPGLAPKAAVFDLAASLGTLLDEVQGEGADPNAIRTLDMGAHSEHWRQAQTFLDILFDAWPAVREDLFGGALDPEARQRVRVAAQIAAWQTAPPDHPVIVAGSTGSRSTTRLLMSAVARLPQGALVLPGFDGDIQPELWRTMAGMLGGSAEQFPFEHPQSAFVRLCADLGVDPAGIPPWVDAGWSTARGRLVSLSLHPAPVTDAWRDAAPERVEEVDGATSGLTLIEAPDPRREALTTAWAIRAAVETGKRVALVTPDRVLSRRVTAALGRWGLRPDDSAGRPLHLTPPGVLSRLVLDALAAPLTPRALLALLKHPLVGGSGEDRNRHLRLVETLELRQLRGKGALIRWSALVDWAAAAGDAAPDWIDWMRVALAPVLETGGAQPIAHWVTAHRTALTALSAGPGGGEAAVWDKAAGEAVVSLFDRLEEAAGSAGAVTAVEYRTLFAGLLTGEQVREDGFLPRSDIVILGALEARMQSADLVIIGGLNEGIWPGAPRPDPWLNRRMRQDVGLPPPERQTGLAAHDYQNAVSAREVLLTRSVTVDGAPAVPSRWLNRLLNLTEGLGPAGKAAVDRMRARGGDLLVQAAAFDRIAERVPPAPRPSPAPPTAARPTQLSVTDVERLIRDPYAIYAKRVLGLAPLLPLGPGPEALERGTNLHAVMETFVARLAEGWPDAAEEVFRDALDTTLAGSEAEAVRLAWSARLLRVLAPLLTREAERRRLGVPFAREVRGERTLPALGLTLTAIADRIDRMPDGRLAIYDYKSGAIPTKSSLGKFDKQLLLEGAIAEEGGFADIPPAKVGRLEYLGLSAKCDALNIEDVADRIDETWREFGLLMTAYAARTKGYPSRTRLKSVSDSGDYDHLARHGEWSDSDTPEHQDVGQ